MDDAHTGSAGHAEDHAGRGIALGLHEELLLLMLHDERGTVAGGTMDQQALAGAAIAELIVLERLRIEGEGKSARVVAGDTAPTGDDVLDQCLSMIESSRRARTLSDLVGRAAQMRNLRGRVAAHLVDLRVLRREKDRVMLVFPRTRYPEADHSAEAEVVGRLRRAIFGGGEVEDARTAMLISLAQGTDVLRLVFDRRDLKRRRARIDAIVRGELVGAATGRAIEATIAAVAACSAAAVVAATAAATS